MTLPERHTTRLKNYDYSQPGAYFITLCTEHRRCCFGAINDGDLQLNTIGKMITSVWQSLATQIVYIKLDEFVVMPNHFHGIVFINRERAIHELPLQNPPPTSVGAIQESPTVARLRRDTRRQMLLPKIVGRFKMQTAKQFNLSSSNDGTAQWQRNYHEHIIRNDADLTRLREYITHNPLRWSLDRENPDNRQQP